MPPDPRHVTILLCTLNGAAFLREQLASYLRQTHGNWSLWVSDDGSTDGTGDILAAFARDHGRANGGAHDIRLLRGPGRGGSAANFLSLLGHPDLPPGLVALSDQDDIWLPGKLARALRCIPAGAAEPVIYSAQSFYIDGAGRRIGGSRPPPGAPVFATAMLQNVLAGHSMVLNAQALALVRAAGQPPVPFHDWWLTLLVTAAGGRAVLDRRRVLLYRQHGGNVMGAPGGLRAGLRRASLVLAQDYGTWVAANARALQAAAPLLPAPQRATVAAFLAAPRRAGPGRIALLRRLGLRRQGWRATAVVYLAALLGRV
ncbi:glycosyltransferase [Fertoebacter nigrum]|uniref:Glycosyltransferase n=1 Tax=Fertoeibacter niger TaxID=2656921 RepID=A0A8X8H0E9_9RHOB|nr:glycosyltransferase [Fertoeibacter niger]NUB46527.1 glycosyltransferase [Fertoeibacter niger]